MITSRIFCLSLVATLAMGGCSLILDPQVGDEQTDGSGAGAQGLKFGELCETDSDCGTGRCSDKRCTVTCDDEAPCPEDSKTSCQKGVCRFSTAPPLAEAPKIGFVYVGPVGDHGWTLTHDEGRKYLEQQLTSLKISTSFVPSVAAADAPAVIDQLIAEGSNVIVGTSFDFLNPIQNGAANYPDVNFLLCSGFLSSPNMGSYFGRMYQVKWMVGMLAGKMTKTNRIGIVGPVVIPETVRHANALARGVRLVNPDAVVEVRWVNAWFAPDAEAQATIDLVNGGADIIIGFTDTTVPIETSKDLKTADGDQVYSIGYDNPDSCKIAPNTCLTSAYWNWGPMMKGIVEQMSEGAWDPTVLIWEQMKADPKESAVYLAPINEKLVPTDVRIDVESYIPKLAKPGVEGQMLPFEAPVKDSAGKERLAKGKTFTDEELLRMCWFVEGIVGPDDEDGNHVPGVVPASCPGDH